MIPNIALEQLVLRNKLLTEDEHFASVAIQALQLPILCPVDRHFLLILLEGPRRPLVGQITVHFVVEEKRVGRIVVHFDRYEARLFNLLTELLRISAVAESHR